MTDLKILEYCKKRFGNNSFSGNSIVIELKLTNIVHSQLKRLVEKDLLNSFTKDGYKYYFIN